MLIAKSRIVIWMASLATLFWCFVRVTGELNIVWNMNLLGDNGEKNDCI